MRSIRSKDGTNIAFEITGQGPALILITGALNYSKFGVVGDLVPLLSDKFTVINYDRRGRGQSQSDSPWSIAKEIEDIDALIEIAGGSAHLYGHSAGAALALLTAAALGKRVSSTAAYEPPLCSGWRDELQTRLGIWQFKQLTSQGKNLELITRFMRYVGMDGTLIEETLASEHRDALIAMAPTLSYEARILLHTSHFMRHQARLVTQPVYLLAGDQSFATVLKVQRRLARALPSARTLVISGQTHAVEAKVLAPILEEFFALKKSDRSLKRSVVSLTEYNR